MKTESVERHEVVVIGAGQAGLAAGYHLAQRGIEFVILEASPHVGDVWRDRYDSLRLYSPARYDALPGYPFPLGRNVFPTGSQMGEYLEAYVAHHRLPVCKAVHVDALRAAPDASDGYLISAGPRSYAANQVIVAIGGFQRPHVPEFGPQLDARIRQLHSADYRNPGQLVDGPVLVVGVSHSGADLAYEVAAAGHRTILSGKDHGQLPFSVDSRRGVLAWPIMRFIAWNLLTLSTPIGRKMAPEIRKGGGPLLRIRRSDLERAGVERHEARTAGASDGRPMLADGTVLDVANVIWCTGFRPDYSWIDLPVIGEGGWPMEHRGVVDSSPGLYFLGIPFLYSFTSMLVIGAGRDAAYVVERIAGRRGMRERAIAAAAGSKAL
ncbi:MAG: NAD(P)-binding domain-containing protein [Chloroflexota bacterium]